MSVKKYLPKRPKYQYDYIKYGRNFITQLLIILGVVFSYPSLANTGVNIAKGKVASQSSQYSADFPASRATDGVIDNKITHTLQETGAWWQVDLGDTYDITSIKVSNRTSCCSERLDNFSVLVSEKPLTTNSGGTTFAAKQATFIGSKVFLGNAKGRYVRVFLNGKNYLSLSEVEIFGSQSGKQATPQADVGTKASGVVKGVTNIGAIAFDNLGKEVEGVTEGSKALGTITKVCTAMTIASNSAKKIEGNIAKKLEAEQAAEDAKFDKQMAQLLFEAQQESGVSISDTDTQQLAATMAQIKKKLHTAPPPVEEKWTAFDISKTTLEVAGIADPIGVTSVTAAYLHPICGTADAKLSSQASFCWKESKGRGVGQIPIACNPNLPDNDAGLCYKNCPEGMNGVGPVCWTTKKVSQPRGAGVIPAGCPSSHPSKEGGLCYKPCPDGMSGFATTCKSTKKLSYGRGAGKLSSQANCNAGGGQRQGLICYKQCEAGYTGKGPVCWLNSATSQRGVGISPNACASGAPDLDAGLCYQSCPENMKGVGPACWTEAKVSQPRGAGMVPDQCPSSHPEFDAGLCYQTCSNDRTGVGPVCWSGCSTKYPSACGAGCAKTKLECGLAVADMVSEPLEMIASIATLGGFSLVDKAVGAAKKGAKKATQKAAKEAAEKAAKKAAKELAAETSESLAKKFGKSFLKKARQRIDDIKGATKRLKDTAADVKKTIKDNVLDPVKDKTKKYAKKKADNIKLKLKIDPNKPKSSALVSAEDILARFKKVRKEVFEANDLRAIRLVKECSTAGIKISKDWVPKLP